jgi:vancomycin permeability regulator SanA
MKRKFKLFLLFLCTWIFAHSIYIITVGLNDDPQKADCILILGNKVNEDGTLSDRLQSRVDKGFELYTKKLAPKIIVSGGLGKEGYYEAREMRKSLLKKGVDSSAIIMDDKGLTTYETMQNFLPIAKENNFNSVIIVSQFYHLQRSRAMLHSLKIEYIYTAHSDYFELRDFYSLLREFFAYYAFLITHYFFSA